MTMARRWKRYRLWMGAIFSTLLTINCWGCLNLATSTQPSPAAAEPLQVLFIGNSYTYVNHLPQLFSDLSAAGGHAVVTATAAQGGWTLAQHAESAETLNLLKSHPWDRVILQEQSVIPAIADRRTQRSIPAATTLATAIRAAGGQPLLFMTWGRQQGLPEAGFADYATMQQALATGYEDIARQIQAPVAPVGLAWEHALAADPSLDLWNSDGSHPSLAGSYLAACVFYRVIHQASPVGLTYPEPLSTETATLLQQVAEQTVAAAG